MATKKIKKIKKKEEIPSFLLELGAVPQVLSLPSRSSKTVHHLGPVFFGCLQHHPPPHSLNLGGFHHHKYTISRENILQDLFLPKSIVAEKNVQKTIKFPLVKRPKLFSHPYSNKCPGTRKMFVPELVSPFVDFGKSESIIEGETSQEIPVYCLRKISSRTLETELELVTLSDIREKKRIFMSHNERMAHAHFPKQFVTVRVIGPIVPASITITKLPSKRKPQCDFNFHEKPKVNRSEKEETEETNEKTQKELENSNVNEMESEIISLVDQKELVDSKEDKAGDENLKASVPQTFQGEQSLTEIKEGVAIRGSAENEEINEKKQGEEDEVEEEEEEDENEEEEEEEIQEIEKVAKETLEIESTEGEESEN